MLTFISFLISSLVLLLRLRNRFCLPVSFLECRGSFYVRSLPCHAAVSSDFLPFFFLIFFNVRCSSCTAFRCREKEELKKKSKQ